MRSSNRLDQAGRIFGGTVLSLLGACAGVVLAGCHSAGPYGHARGYTPTHDEEREVAAGKEYDPVMAERFPDQWRDKPVWLFGVVVNRGTGPGGSAYVTLSIRSLEPRNLCESADEDSCRVTVGDREHARRKALVRLGAEDELGEHAVGLGSLLRVSGSFGAEVDPGDGTPIFRARYYRHWPRGFYVTSKAASLMRR